jgi:hypothetical protein
MRRLVSRPRFRRVAWLIFWTLCLVGLALFWYRTTGSEKWWRGCRYAMANRDNLGAFAFNGKMMFFFASKASVTSESPGFDTNFSIRQSYEDPCSFNAAIWFCNEFAGGYFVPKGTDIHFMGFRLLILDDWSLPAVTGVSPPSSPVRAVIVPFWFLEALFFLPVVFIGRRYWHVRQRLHRGLCPACGYDLRATPQRCPECGRVSEAPVARFGERAG